MSDPLAKFARTGRTTRAISEAISLAAQGYYVFLVISHQRLMQVEERRVLSTAAELGLPVDPVNGGKLYVGGRGGSIQLVHITDETFDVERMRPRSAHPSCRVVVDPAAVEARFGAQLRAYHQYDEDQANGA